MSKVQRGEDDTLVSSLHWAAASGRLDDVRHLLTTDVKIVNSRDEKQRTPLHCAALEGHFSVVKYLVEQGAHVDSKDEDNLTALYEAARNGHSDVVKYLNDHGAKQSTLLHYAAKCGQGDVVEYLVEQGAQVNSKDETGVCTMHDPRTKVCLKMHTCDSPEYKYKRTPLHYAAKCGQGNVVKYLVEQGSRVESKDETGRTSLHYAAMHGQIDVVEHLVEQGAQVNCKDESDRTSLHYAAMHGQIYVVKHLVEQGAQVNCKDESDRTPLHYAAEYDHSNVVKYLVEQKAQVNCKDKYHRTPLHLTSYNGQTETVKLLLEKGADPTAEDLSGRNCLHLAIKAQHKETVDFLLWNVQSWKEMLKKCDSFLETPLKYLIESMPDVAEMSLSRCVKTNEGERTAAMDKVRPSSEAFQVTYDYGFLQEVNSDSLRYQRKSFKKTHPLYYISESNSPKLLCHPLVRSLLKYKWDSFGHKIFFANLSLYLLFLLCLTTFALMSLGPLEKECKSESINGSEPGDCKGTFKYTFLKISAASTILLAVIRLFMEFIQLIIIHGPREYLSDFVNYMEITLYISSITFVFVFRTPCLRIYHWQWQLGVLAVFLGWLVLITFLQKWPSTGIYVIAFLTTMKSFLKVAFLAVLLVITFALPFYMQFFEPGKTRHAFIHPARALVKVMSMTTGELDYDDIFHHREGEEEIAFPLISFPLWIIFLVMMPVLLNNYLTGLAVGDVKEMVQQCQVSKVKLQIDLVLSLEGMLKRFDLLSSRFFPPIPVQRGPIFINKSFADGHYTAGSEIAEAIKPRPKPLVDQIEANLKQLSQQQGQQLEANLKQQNEEQGQQLVAKLKVQSEEYSKQLREQNAEHGKQSQQLAAEIDQKREETIRRLENKLQEQINEVQSQIGQLSNDVASMKELLMKLASK